MPCSQNKDLKCNRIGKLPAPLSCLGTFYDPYSFFKLPIFTLSSFFSFFMSSYGHIVMILGFCVGGSTVAAHMRSGLKSMGLSPT